MMQALQAVRRTSTRRCLSAKPAVGHSGHLSADSLKNQHDAPDLGLAMSHKHKYLFDLNGYLVLRGVFSPDDVAAANAGPAIMAGDVLLFSEATLHGTLPWTLDHQRRTVIYRFAPAGSAYGRGYAPEWPAAMLAGMSEAQRAVCAPPYHPRMNRTCLDEEGSAVAPKPREAWKVEFDEKVFGSRYF
ncbi:phytanoyl-CoA dioxygenase [Aureococcus anophagefferens]|nr:phytanoyl-CoA dioxygenase [Aureococcus anophagefferens]